VTLKYTDQFLLVQGTAGSTVNSLIFKINSLFQVNLTATNGTPQGVAELQTKFARYRVVNSAIHWRIVGLQPGGSFGGSGTLGVAPTNSLMAAGVLYPLPRGGATSTTMISASVQKYATKRFDWPIDVAVPSAATPAASVVNPRTVWKGSHSMAVSKLDADPDPKQTSYTAAFGADPTSIDYWVFAFADTLADSTGKKAYLAEIDMHQDVYAFDRIVVTDALRDHVLSSLVMSSCEEKKERPLPKVALPVVPPVVAPVHEAFPSAYPEGFVLVRAPPKSHSLKS
jgi:hypothetical protein